MTEYTKLDPPENFFAVGTTEACFVVDELSCAESLSSIDSLVTRYTHLRVGRLKLAQDTNCATCKQLTTVP